MAEPELFALMDQVLSALLAVNDAHGRARQAGMIDRAISLNLVERSAQDAVLALDELLRIEGTPYQPPPGGGPRGGRRLRVAA
jgi:hypothetical protein